MAVFFSASLIDLDHIGEENSPIFLKLLVAKHDLRTKYREDDKVMQSRVHRPEVEGTLDFCSRAAQKGRSIPDRPGSQLLSSAATGEHLLALQMRRAAFSFLLFRIFTVSLIHHSPCTEALPFAYKID